MFNIQPGFTIVEPYDETSLHGVRPTWTTIPTIGFGKIVSTGVHKYSKGSEVMFSLLDQHGPLVVGETLIIDDTEYMLLRDSAIIAVYNKHSVPTQEFTFGH